MAFQLFALQPPKPVSETRTLTDSAQPGVEAVVTLRAPVGGISAMEIDTRAFELIGKYVTGTSNPDGVAYPVTLPGHEPITPTVGSCHVIARLMAMTIPSEDFSVRAFEEWCYFSVVMPGAYQDLARWSWEIISGEGVSAAAGKRLRGDYGGTVRAALHERAGNHPLYLINVAHLLWSINERIGALLPPGNEVGAVIAPLGSEFLADCEASLLLSSLPDKKTNPR